MLGRWYSSLSLRTKVTAITTAITTLALMGVALVGILQMRSQIAEEQRRAADSVALGVARAAELAIAVRDTNELARLTNSFLRDRNILFIAVYAQAASPLASAVRSPEAWDQFRHGTRRTDQWVIGEREVEPSVRTDEFANLSDTEAPSSDANAAKTLTGAAGAIGRIVVGLSTAGAAEAQHRENQLMIATTLTTAAIVAGILLLTLRSWMRRLERLADASNAISRGDFSAPVHDQRDDEIGKLARSFDEMRSALSERDRKLQTFTDTLQQQVKQRTSDLEQAVVAAQEASRAKSLFLANMSHELRTPLNGVIGMVDLLLAASPSPEQRRYCDIAKGSARSLLELINDILDFSKIEAGKLDIDCVDFDLHEVIEGIAGMFGDRAEKKKIELVCGLASDLPRWVNGDPVRVRQVISNLLSNAIKFTQAGEVVLQVAIESADEAGSVVRFTVKDSGIGIPRERVDRLFQSFTQVDSSTTRKFGGTGLGLAISRRIVDLMGGQIGVESREGEGSTFWFTARVGKAMQQPARESSADPRGLRVLAVDDNATNREILEAQLASWSMRPELASDAAQAMRMLHTAARDGQPFRFALLDMHMPDTDGLILAQQIKSDPLIQDVILISLSSISDPVKPGQMASYGLAASLTKPVLPSQLYNTIIDCLAAGGSLSGKPAQVPSEAAGLPLLTGVRILLAEDNEVNQLVASELLGQAGCQCALAVNGREAVEKAMQGEFDVILMDCQMPEMDGLEATRTIRAAEKSSPVPRRRPIIALTANAIKGDRELCLASGMDGYVTKPIDPAELFHTIASFLQRGPASHPPQPSAAAGQLAASLSPPLDLPSLERRCMGNRKLAAKLLNRFESSTAADMQTLLGSVRSGDAGSVASLAHKIKGAAANVSAESLRCVIAELEQLAKTGAMSQAQSCLEQLDREMKRFREYVATALTKLASDNDASPSLVGKT